MEHTRPNTSQVFHVEHTGYAPLMQTLLDHHKALLGQWRRSMNLVGPGPLEHHYVDAQEALELIQSPSGNWVDLGTGAGFPGIIFGAMFPDTSIELVDSRAKRCAFLERVLATAEDDTSHIQVRCARLESLEPGSYDGILSRALAAPAMMMQHAQRLLRPKGVLLILLQADGELPPSDDFQVMMQRQYTIAGKGRRAVLLKFVPDRDDA